MTIAATRDIAMKRHTAAPALNVLFTSSWAFRLLIVLLREGKNKIAKTIPRIIPTGQKITPQPNTAINNIIMSISRIG